MNTLTWVFFALFLISLALHIFSYVKKMTLLQKISIAFAIPFATVFETLILFTKLPDSYHLIIITILSSCFATTAVILQFFRKNSFINKAVHYLYFLTVAVWNCVYFPTFFIYRIPGWFSISFLILYTIIFIILCIFIKKQKLSYYFGIILCFLDSVLLNICSFAALCFGKKLYALILFLGTTVMFCDMLFYFIKTHSLKIKHDKFIVVMAFIISQIVITGAGIMMITF